MAEYPNPPLLTSAPTDGQVAVYQASTNTWVPMTVTAAAISVPGTHIAPESDPAAVTTSALATTAATQTTPWGFASEAQAEAIATKFNLAVTDIGNLSTSLEDTIDTLNTLLTELQTAGILASS